MIFVTDENFMVRGARLLEVFDRENEIRALTSLYPAGTEDVDWLRKLAEQNPKPVVVGGDGRILRNPAESQVLRECDLMFVYLAPGWTNLVWSVFAWKIIKAWPDIVRNVTQAMRPTIFEVSCSSLKVERRGLVADLKKR